MVDELYENRHPSGKRPIWVYIMRYERHAFYPPNTIGAFMDERIVGILGVRNVNHVSLLFVDRDHHHQGIADQ